MQDSPTTECYLDCPFLDAKSRTCYRGKPHNIETSDNGNVFYKTEYCTAFKKYIELLAEEISKEQLSKVYNVIQKNKNE